MMRQASRHACTHEHRRAFLLSCIEAIREIQGSRGHGQIIRSEEHACSSICIAVSGSIAHAH
jgi:hypothetical protein